MERTDKAFLGLQIFSATFCQIIVFRNATQVSFQELKNENLNLPIFQRIDTKKFSDASASRMNLEVELVADENVVVDVDVAAVVVVVVGVDVAVVAATLEPSASAQRRIRRRTDERLRSRRRRRRWMRRRRHVALVARDPAGEAGGLDGLVGLKSENKNH